MDELDKEYGEDEGYAAVKAGVQRVEVALTLVPTLALTLTLIMC